MKKIEAKEYHLDIRNPSCKKINLLSRMLRVFTGVRYRGRFLTSYFSSDTRRTTHGRTYSPLYLDKRRRRSW